MGGHEELGLDHSAPAGLVPLGSGVGGLGLGQDKLNSSTQWDCQPKSQKDGHCTSRFGVNILRKSVNSSGTIFSYTKNSTVTKLSNFNDFLQV